MSFTPIMSDDELSRPNPPTASAVAKRPRADTLTPIPEARPSTQQRTGGSHNVSVYSHPPTSTSPPSRLPPSSPPGTLVPYDSDYEETYNEMEIENLVADGAAGRLTPPPAKARAERKSAPVESDGEDSDDDISNNDMLAQISSILQAHTRKQNKHIRSLEKKVDYLLSLVNEQIETDEQTDHAAGRGKPKPTWSQVAAGTPINSSLKGKGKGKAAAKTPTTPATMENTKAQRRFMIIREPEETSTFQPHRIRDAINNALTTSNAPTELKVASVSINPRGNIVILTTENCNSRDILEYKEAIETAVRETDGKTRNVHTTDHWHKLLVHGVSLFAFPDNESGLSGFRDEIETYNPHVQLMTQPRYLTRPEKRAGKNHSSMVIALQNEEDASRVERSGVYLRGVKMKTGKFIATRPFDQCVRCARFGHSWQRCKGQETCRMCAGNHLTSRHECNICNIKGKPCTHTKLLCIHCTGHHRSTDPTCPKIQELRG
jgi:hypothetical protein